MKKVITKTCDGKTNIEFHAENPKMPARTAPAIKCLFNHYGVPTYRLVNGNTQSVESYNSLWNPPKSKIKPKNYKGPSDSLMLLEK